VKRLFISDCEGPISKNDNAFEITAHFVPDGEKLFTVISRYDDVLADIVKKADYRAGDTLKLILPFLKAHGVTDAKMRQFSVQTLLLISGIKNALKHVIGIAHAYIVSTSYEHYLKAVCQAIAFPFANTYCTRVSIDKYRLTEEEKKNLKETAKEISQMPIIDISFNAKTLNNLSQRDQIIVRRLDEIFWKEITCTDCGRMFSQVNPVGGSEKADKIGEVAQKLGVSLADVMYVGDSITDVEAFRLVRENGGLTVSFNGNQYAIKNAEVMVLSEQAIVTAVIADVFGRFGKEEALSLVENWNRKALEKSLMNRALLDSLFAFYLNSLPKVKIITKENMEKLTEESSEFRKKVRGEAIGRLG